MATPINGSRIVRLAKSSGVVEVTLTRLPGEARGDTAHAAGYDPVDATGAGSHYGFTVRDYPGSGTVVVTMATD